MRTSIATVCLSGTLEVKMQAVAAAGFEGIEVFENDLITSPLTPQRVRSLAADLGLSVDLYQPFRDFEGVSTEMFARNLHRATAKLDIAAELGAPTMLLCSNVGTAVTDDEPIVTDQLLQIADLAEQRGVKVAYEALAWGKYVSTYERSWELVRAVDHNALGLCLDSFHIFSAGSDLSGLKKIPGDKIFFCQLADAPALDLDVLSWSRHYRVFPGQGSFDIASFVAALRETGYDGPVSPEVFNDVFRQTDPYRTAVDALRSLRYIEDEVATSSGSTSDGDTRINLNRLAPMRGAEGFNFVELRADKDGAITRALGLMGFSDKGRHRSKDVELWTQGDVRVVVSTVPEAGESAGVTALGVDVGDACDAAARAAALLAPTVERITNPGEVKLRAVRAPDGTEIYFCDDSLAAVRDWVTEFGPAGAYTESAVGLLMIDHVSLSQPWQHFDEAVLFYKSLLDLRPNSSIDIADPHGLVRSQVMSNDVGTVRLALDVLPTTVAADNQRGNASGQEHIAFRCADLLTTARSLNTRGLPLLIIPENYYADLQARYRLSTEVIDELHDLNVLYDEDDRGAFLQLYSGTIGHVFFEFVQRVGVYDGYGATNAPIRRAAQYRAAWGHVASS